MSYLRVLDLSYNRFKKIQHLGIWRLCHLKQLIASSNPINIEVTDSPKNVSECSQYALERLDLSDYLNGTVPESLGRLANLRSLDLSDSSLTGTIPEALGRLRYLEALDLSYNQLDGSIPESLGRLVNLRDIKLRVNRLTGDGKLLTNAHCVEHNTQVKVKRRGDDINGKWEILERSRATSVWAFTSSSGISKIPAQIRKILIVAVSNIKMLVLQAIKLFRFIVMDKCQWLVVPLMILQAFNKVLEHILLLETYTQESVPTLHKIR
ncbi:hypothetical protein L1887_14654 [Cichorium endivia]|nr:hypothetical protein L1887_14654 [Cichorium endivia]